MKGRGRALIFDAGEQCLMTRSDFMISPGQTQAISNGGST